MIRSYRKRFGAFAPKVALLGFLANFLMACGGGEPPTSATAAGGSSAAAGGGSAAAGGGGQVATGGATNVGQVTFQITASVAPAIATVGVVEWSIDKSPIDQAQIEFGRTGTEYVAPVDLSAASYRTLLLGMKPNTEYTFRIVATSSGTTYTSEPQVLKTGFLPNALPPVRVTDSNPSKLYGGFTVSCNGVGMGTPGQPQAGDSFAFILDKEGEYVWAYDLSDSPVGECTRARFSYDGRYFWVGNFNNVNTKGALRRITLDGENEQDFALGGRHHDFTTLPQNHILFHEQENGGGTIGNEGADIIKELDPESGQVTVLYNERDNFADIADDVGAHTNYITYVPEHQAISFSMRHSDTIVLLGYPSAEVLGIFNGVKDQFGLAAGGIDWDAQHGHQFFADHLLVFNNADDDTESHVLEFQFDLAQKSAQLLSTYSGGEKSIAFGDVRRLPGGNTFITYSNVGIMHEIDQERVLLREISVGPIGYSSHRKSLYGEEERP